MVLGVRSLGVSANRGLRFRDLRVLGVLVLDAAQVGNCQDFRRLQRNRVGPQAS